MSITLDGGVNLPKIYVYSVPEYEKTPWEGGRAGKGLLKVGFTAQDVDKRIRQQLQGVKMPTGLKFTLHLVETAVTNLGDVFMDHSVHTQLITAGIKRVSGEWFECTADEAKAAIHAVKASKPLSNLRPQMTFPMRPEQKQAVETTAKYFRKHANEDQPPHFLWNAKMRFGKTFTSYQLALEMGWTKVLVLTYKPAVEKAWRDDLLTHSDFSGWQFKSRGGDQTDAAKVEKLVWFASFQDVMGTDENGQPKTRNLGMYDIEWDAVFVDEYHFGAWRDAAKALYAGDDEGGVGDPSEKKAIENPDLTEDDFVDALEDNLQLKVNHYLYLSGTPFRALTNGEFLEDQVFNWTYGDEQRAKDSWTGKEANPYRALPRMHMLSYEMPDSLKKIALNNHSEFSLTEFFKAKKDDSGTQVFLHENEVQKWLDVLRGQDVNGLWGNIANNLKPPMPFEDTNLLAALQHSIWYLPDVAACEAMAGLLSAQHNVFYRDFHVNIAAGSKAGIGEKALPPVAKAIGAVPQNTKTITLTCGKLMTGVTVPAWTAIVMLRELKSPETYFQAAFRIQSPWTMNVVDTEAGGEKEVVIKEHCYVIDFAPNRALRQIVDYATKLRASVTSDRNDEEAVDEFMAFLPVLSFDGYSMTQLKAADVIDYLTRGISASMLARRWNSPELITLDIRAMEQILGNQELLDSLEGIEMFRNIKNDLTALISVNKELQPKRLSREKLNPDEKKKVDESKKQRDTLRKKLQRFITRIPAFMYLTDEREKTVKDVITEVEPALFKKVTNLTIKDFENLVNANVFNDAKMNDAVWKFRQYEEPSLGYGTTPPEIAVVGGWNLRHDDRVWDLLEEEKLQSGEDLLGDYLGSIIIAKLTIDGGIAWNGLRYDTPDDAVGAATNGDLSDGMAFWGVLRNSQIKKLGEL